MYKTDTFGGLVLLNNKCNNNCKYCYENNTGNEFVTTLQIDKFINFLGRNGFNKHLSFFGGEPSFSLPVINDIMNKYKDTHTFSLTSNGLFIDRDDRDIIILRDMANINISIEGTQEAYEKLRGGKVNLKELISKFYERGFKNITFNISLNNNIFDNLDELIDIYEFINKFNFKSHFYSIKSDYGFNLDNKYIESIYYKLKDLKSINKELFHNIIKFNNKNLESELKNDTKVQFLCRFDNKIALSSDGMNLITCAWNKSQSIGVLDETPDKDILDNYFTMIGLNHRSLFHCNECLVDTGYCSISCKYYLDDLITNNKLDELNYNCKFQHMLYNLYLDEVLEYCTQ